VFSRHLPRGTEPEPFGSSVSPASHGTSLRAGTEPRHMAQDLRQALLFMGSFQKDFLEKNGLFHMIMDQYLLIPFLVG